MRKKAGDWFCPACNDLQFAKNTECRKCGEPNPDPEGSEAAKEAGIAAGHGGQEMKPGDWFCPACNDLQFAKNTKCRKCGEANPDPEGSMEAAQASGSFKVLDKKPGDWTCASCGDHQFARNESCRKCGAAKPGGGKGGGKGKKGGKGGMGNMMGNMQGNMMGNMMGNMGSMGGGGGNMVMITQEMLMNMMMGMGGGGGCQGMGNMMSMMGGGMGNMMGGKGGGKCGKGGSKGKKFAPY